jgi:hypothetical protein
VGGVLVSLVLLPLYLARRRRDKARLAAMVAADARAEAAARASDPLLDLLDTTSQDAGNSSGFSPPS